MKHLVHFDKRHRHCISNPRKNIYVVKILRSEVEYMFATALYQYKNGNSIKGEDELNYELSENEYEWFTSEFQSAIGAIYDKLRSATTNDLARMMSNEIVDSPEEHSIVFGFSDNWIGSPNALLTSVDGYIKARIIADWWTNVGNTTQASTYSSLAQTHIRTAYNNINAYDIPQTFSQY